MENNTNAMDKEQIKKLIREEGLKLIQEYNKTSAFTDRKLTDTPTDALQVVNRRFVTLNGATANRPVTSIIGQRYFDTSLNQPVWVGNNFAWVDANGDPI